MRSKADWKNVDWRDVYLHVSLESSHLIIHEVVVSVYLAITHLSVIGVVEGLSAGVGGVGVEGGDALTGGELVGVLLLVGRRLDGRVAFSGHNRLSFARRLLRIFSLKASVFTILYNCTVIVRMLQLTFLRDPLGVNQLKRLSRKDSFL